MNTTDKEVESKKKMSLALVKRLVPILSWFPSYEWKNYFMFDLMAGFTIACISVPHSLAFATLANIDLIYGLNTACFSPFIYAVFGTAVLSSFGPVAIGSMLMGESIDKFDYVELDFNKEQYAAGLTVSIGAFYLIMFFLRLGVLTIMFTKPFISGFSMACTLHILLKSMRQLFGIHVQFKHGTFNFYHNLILFCSTLGDTHIPTIIISVTVLTMFCLNCVVLTPFLKKHTSINFPIETIVMIGSILVSYFFNFKDMGVDVIGTLPSGLPTFIPPTFSSFVTSFPEAVPIALINYATATTTTLLFNPGLDREQETLAMSLSNIICGNFQCLTLGNSLMRCMIAKSIGAKTLLSPMISSLFMFLIILFAGPLFEALPLTILSCIIAASISQLLYERAFDLKIFKNSNDDLLIFFGTLFTTLFLDVSIGVIVGVTLSLKTILLGVKENEEKQKKQKINEENGLLLNHPTV